MPKQFEDISSADSNNNIFTADQYNRFDTDLLLTGAWFLECERNVVHKEEAYLVPPPSPSATATTHLQVEDEEGAECEEEPVAPPNLSRGRGVRGTKRKNKSKDAPVPPSSEGNTENVDVPIVPQHKSANASRQMTPGSHGSHGSQGAVVKGGTPAEIFSQQSQGLSAGRPGGISSQASEGGVFNACSRDSAQSPHRGGEAKLVKRPVPVPKPVATPSCGPEVPKLPMYLELGNPVELVCESNHKSTWVPQIMEIVSHIHKVHTSTLLTLSFDSWIQCLL